MSFSATNVTGLNSNVLYNHIQGNFSARGFGLSLDTANNLGYGIGKTIRGAFDNLWNTWQKMSTPEPPALEIAQQRNYMIYQGGLKECVKRLGPALANLQMSPNDRGALEKVEQLSAHFARYLKPNRKRNLRELQSTTFRPLEERVSAIAHLPIKSALSKCMPVFFQRNNSICEKAHTELHSAHTRQSQVMQKFDGDQVWRSSQGIEEFLASLTSSEETHQSYSHQLVYGFRSIFNSLDTGISRLFSILPGVSAELVEPDEHEFTFLRTNDQNWEIAQADVAFVAYATCSGELNSNAASDSVIAIDTRNNKVIANIKVGLLPFGIAITPNSRYVYIANYGGNTLSIIDTYSNSLFDKDPVGFTFFGIAITPDGMYAYLTSTYTNEIGIIEISSKKVKTSTTPHGIWETAITPNGQYVYVTFTDNSTVGVIETTSNTLFKTIDVGKGPRGIAITPDGLYAYVASSEDNTISIINTTSNKVVGQVYLENANPVSVAINPNGTHAYVTCSGKKSVIVIEMVNSTVSEMIEVDTNPTGIAITPDGVYAYVTNQDVDSNHTIYVINTTDNVVIDRIKINNNGCNNIAITPTKIPILNTDGDNSLIIGLSCGGAGFVMLLGLGGYLSYRWLKKEEASSESTSLINSLSNEQKMILM